MRTSLWKLFHTSRSLAVLLPLVVASSSLRVSAQSSTSPSIQPPALSQPSAQRPLEFEITSIRPHQSGGDEPSDRKMLPGGLFVATATNVRTLIRIAFGTDRISGAPSWIDHETFDINATTANRTEVTNPQQFQQLIVSLLEERFQLKFHREEKEVPIYWLEIDKPGKLGLALKPSTSDSQPNMSKNSSGSRAVMKASKMSMADIAAGLNRQVGRPVEDHTGLTGNFDFQIEWAPEETSDSIDPSLFTVLKEQLGLKLQPARGTAETIVIDQVRHPSAN